jgi:hypothetical protein
MLGLREANYRLTLIHRNELVSAAPLFAALRQLILIRSLDEIVLDVATQPRPSWLFIELLIKARATGRASSH